MRKVAVQDLRVGMYVVELDRPWLGTPFLFQGFEIRDDVELEQLRQLCQHVFVLDAPPAGNNPAARRPAPVAVVPRTTVVAEPRAAPSLDVLKNFAAGTHHTPRYVDTVTPEQELAQAREVHDRARTLVFEIMEDARLGRSLDTTRAKQAVAGMVESVLRNPDALMWLTQMRKKDEYTVTHSLRVCILALAFGRHLDFNTEELNLLGIGALMHDIGKLKVPNEVLNKPGKLTPAEFDIIKRHVPLGVELLESTPGIPRVAIEVARGHHERYDGHGYIMGLKGDNIGLFGSIGAIVDCYDAVTSDRVYHDAISSYDALSTLYESRRKDFHPELVEQFIQCMGIYPIGCLVELNTGAIGVVISVNRERRLKPRVTLVLTPDKKPFIPARTVDLMHAPPGMALEIRRVLPAGSFGINPIAHLPLTA
jgi:putative nucleotidyltransferase with HDIG domain